MWDEAKRLANLEKHKLDFADAALVFENSAKTTYVMPRESEDRKMDVALVEVSGDVLALVYAERGADVRCISFRFASRKERKIYAAEKRSESV